MAHPKRQEFAKELSQALQAPIVYDRINNIWDTCRRAWLSQVSVGAEYTLVLQDDVILCKDFRKKAEAFIEAKEKEGDFVFSFFAGQMLAQRIKMARVAKQDFVISGMIYNEVALCMKTEYIPAMVKWSDDREATTDQEIGRWATMRRLKIMYSVPSLVDHRAELESIYRKNYNKPIPDKPRTAFFYKEN